MYFSLPHSLRLLASLFLLFLGFTKPAAAQIIQPVPSDSVVTPVPPAPTAPATVTSDDPQNTNTSYYAKKIIPASPDVASLGKYVDIPVNNYTGTPDISIPLYTIKTRDLQVPLSLNYHGSGIRVEEEASSVGLGWSLSSGGVIQHRVRGRDDFLDFDAANWRALSTTFAQGLSSPDLCYYYTNPNAAWFVSNNTFSGTPNGTQLDNLLSILFSTNGNYGERGDSERDIFSFSFPGHSGKFVIEPLGNGQYTIRQMPQSDLRIELNRNAHNDPDLTGHSGFVITDTDGIRYTFSTEELQGTRISQENRDTGKKYNTNATGVNTTWGNTETGWVTSAYSITATGAWYLSEIRSVKGDVITFGYSTATDYVLSMPSRKETYLTNTVNTPRWQITETVTKLVYPQSITFPNGTITFSLDTRQDLQTGSKRITGLEVKASTNSTVKKYQFTQGYFDSGSGAEPFVAKRLKLQSVQEITGGNCIPPYSFTYVETVNLPNKDSYAQDYWGYYNGKTANETAGAPPLNSATGTPKIGSMLPPIQTGQYSLPGSFTPANREADATYMRANVLTKIAYPTGGTAEFDFQAHVSNNLMYNPSFGRYYIRVQDGPGSTVTGGGLRINAIITTSAAGVTQTTTYDYGSTGKQMASLQFADFVFVGSNVYQLQYSSAPMSPLGSGAQGNPVGYSSVVVYKGGSSNGQSIYSYYNKVDEKAADFCIPTSSGTLIEGASCTSAAGQQPAASPELCDPYGSPFFSNYNSIKDLTVPNYVYTLNGSLLEERHYSGDGKLIKRVNNDYEVVNRVRIKNFRLMLRSTRFSSFIYYSDSEWPRITKSIVNDYGGGASSTLFTSTTTAYGYNSTGAHKQVISLLTTDKSGEKITITRTYPPDVSPATSISTGLVGLNMLAALMQESEILTKVNNTTVSVHSTKTNYAFYNAGAWMAPNTIESQVGSNPFVTDATFEYTTGGDVSAVTGRDNIRTTFSYFNGSGKTALPQTRVVGANSLSSAQTTAYDYLPLVGLNTTTGPNGLTTNYVYDGYNRLTAIKDGNANLLKTFEYNYAGSNGVSGCATKQIPAAVPDLTVINYGGPTTTYGPTNIYLEVDVFELNSVTTSGPIVILINKDPKINLSFPSASVAVGGRPVQNSAWSFDADSNEFYYVLTTNQSIPAGGVLSFGLTGVLSPGATSGIISAITLISSGSGGETKTINNMSFIKFSYFQ
ncbi:hypothetical protein [Spirosoma sp. KNUC1025]|uniref:hypothetical protein n=1 Tax=Spirosoma sp. KNUC1025 TaxID=2894082 RepID=UPI003867F7BD|nr:hypothetical protein LN737_25260 [Spirosoma sp. KNUC1025]